MQCGGGAICFDGHDVFRYQIYPGYKQSRKEKKEVGTHTEVYQGDKTASEVIASLIQPTMEVFKYHGVCAVQKAELEADDLLASAGYYFTKRNPDDSVVLLARDKDALQSISKKVCMYTPPMSKLPEKIWTPEAVQKSKGMTPKQFHRYQILLGDATDDIPPIPKIGTPAKAKSIVTRFNKLSDYFETEEGMEVYKSYASELVRNRQLVTMVKTAWTDKDIKFKLTGDNKYAPALGVLKSTLSKRSLF